jgi:hypothetical protein
MFTKIAARAESAYAQLTSSALAGNSPLTTTTSIDYERNGRALAQSSSPDTVFRGTMGNNGTEKEFRLEGYNVKNGAQSGSFENNRGGKFRLNFGALKAIKQKLFPKRVFNQSFVESTVQERFNAQDKIAPFSLVC